jgi:hypothetical protein
LQDAKRTPEKSWNSDQCRSLIGWISLGKNEANPRMPTDYMTVQQPVKGMIHIITMSKIYKNVLMLLGIPGQNKLSMNVNAG